MSRTWTGSTRRRSPRVEAKGDYGPGGPYLGANAQCVISKSCFVVLRRTGAISVSTHLRYIERDCVPHDG
jgi:hypothetical protein